MPVIQNSPQFELFARHIYDATDSFFAEATYNLLNDENTKDNPVMYIGAAMELVRHERQLWALFPDVLRLNLESLAYNALCDQVHDFLFSTECSEVLADYFFSDFSNFPTLVSLLRGFFVSQKSKDDLLLILERRFRADIQGLRAKVSDKQMNISTSLDVTRGVTAIFDKIDVLETTPLQQASQFKDRMLEVKTSILENAELKFETAAARSIGRSIELIFNSPTKQEEELHAILSIGQAIQFSNNRLEFMTVHNSLMFVRLASFGGLQWQVEQQVLQTIAPYMPPDLTRQFDELKGELQKSTDLNVQWQSQRPDAPLAVFVVGKLFTNGMAQNLVTQLPQQLADLQKEFEGFFKNTEKHKRLEWVYEDNQVRYTLQSSKIQLELTSPLFFAIMIFAMTTAQSMTLGQLVAVTGISGPNLKLLISKAMSPQLLLFTASKKEIDEQTVLGWNSKYETKGKKKMTVIIHAKFCLGMAQPAQMDALLARKRLEIYGGSIRNAMKERPKMKVGTLKESVAQRISASFRFNDLEFTQALNGLKGKGIIKDDREKDYLVLTQPKK
jgi:hypothetical protein